MGWTCHAYLAGKQGEWKIAHTELDGFAGCMREGSVSALRNCTGNRLKSSAKTFDNAI
jgi:hypothetical protein